MLHVSSDISCDYDTRLFLFFNLRHPRDFTSPTSRRGTFYVRMYDMHTYVDSKMRLKRAGLDDSVLDDSFHVHLCRDLNNLLTLVK